MTNSTTPTPQGSGSPSDAGGSLLGHSLSPSDSDLTFKYYLHQWEQVRHCENMRSAFSLQLLTVAAGSVAGYFYFKECGGLQVALATVVAAIGALGFFVVRALEAAANIHIRRARKARACLPHIDALASGKSGFLPLARYFLALNLLIVFFGVTLTAIAALRLSETGWTQCTFA